jgi:hypothetical protein
VDVTRHAVDRIDGRVLIFEHLLRIVLQKRRSCRGRSSLALLDDEFQQGCPIQDLPQVNPRFTHSLLAPLVSQG